MEGLNTTQIVLLTLLVSFVTSIATGIVTVTLMDQAPAGVTQTINRIVERTVETVVPEKTQGAIITKTVVVKEEDFIIKAVESNSSALVDIKDDKMETISFGFLIQEGNFIVADNNNLNQGKTYVVLLAGIENNFRAEVVFNDREKHFAILKLIYPEDFKDTNLITENSAILDESYPNLGQSVVALGQNEEEQIFLGTVVGFKKSQLVEEDQVATSSEKVLNIEKPLIKTNIGLNIVDSGGPLLNTAGRVVGVNIVAKDFRYTIPAQNIRIAITSLKEKLVE